MRCPLCGSSAVTSRACVPDFVERVQQGADPYDLLCSDEAEAECKVCGHVFIPQASIDDGQ